MLKEGGSSATLGLKVVASPHPFRRPLPMSVPQDGRSKKSRRGRKGSSYLGSAASDASGSSYMEDEALLSADAPVNDQDLLRTFKYVHISLPLRLRPLRHRCPHCHCRYWVGKRPVFPPRLRKPQLTHPIWFQQQESTGKRCEHDSARSNGPGCAGPPLFEEECAVLVRGAPSQRPTRASYPRHHVSSSGLLISRKYSQKPGQLGPVAGFRWPTVVSRRDAAGGFGS